MSRIIFQLFIRALPFQTPAERTFHVSYLNSPRDTRLWSPPSADSNTYAAAAKTASAHKATLRAAEAISVVGLKVVVDEGFRHQIKKEWFEAMARDPVDDAVAEIAKLLPVSDEPVKGSVCACLH